MQLALLIVTEFLLITVDPLLILWPLKWVQISIPTMTLALQLPFAPYGPATIGGHSIIILHCREIFRTESCLESRGMII